MFLWINEFIRAHRASKKQTMPQLFSYGTLQLPSVQLSSFNRFLTGTADTLPNFTLGTLEITDPQVLAISNQQHHPIAIPSSGDSITGMVFELTEQELLQADRYEVDYTRELVTLASGIQAWIYLPKN